MALSQQEFAKALSLVTRSRKNSPVLNEADRILASDLTVVLVILLLGEVEEYVEAVGNGSQKLSHCEAVGNQVAEWMDVFIFLLIIFKETKLYPDLGLLTTAQSIRGDLTKLIAEINERLIVMKGGFTQARLDRVMEVWQIVETYLPAGINVALAVLDKLNTNGWNRPQEYYQNHDDAGKELTEAEMYERYLHSERCLRMIRNHFSQVFGKKVRLYWWMHRPFAQYILDFKHSQMNLDALRMALINSASIYQRMLQEAASQPNINREELILLALAAGGRPLLVVPEPQIPSPSFSINLNDSSIN